MAFDLVLEPEALGGVGVRDTLRDAFANLAPPEKLDPVAWGARYRHLSAKEASRPGPWDPERTPWVKEILWELSDESPAQIVVMPKGAQIGATEVGFVWSGWSFDQDPGTMITLWPTDAFIKRSLKQRVDPFVNACEPLVRLFGGKQGRGRNNTLAQKSGPGGEWIFASAKSAANLRSTPAVRAMADEIDAADEDLAGEGDVVDLLIGRLSDAGPRMKLFIPCTPTIESKSIVWAWWLQSDQRRFLVPCPHCGAFQPLEWEMMRWPKGSPHLAEMVCQHCGHGIQEKSKRLILPEGRFEAQAVASYPRCVGFHVSSLYAPLGSYSWEQVCSQFEGAKGREEKLKTFYNLRLGLPWKQTSDAPDAAALEANRDPIAPGSLPERCLAITAGADVQGDRVEVRIWGWGRGLESWLLKKVVVPRFKDRVGDDGLTRDPRPLVEIAAEIRREVNDARFTRADGAKRWMEFGLLDVNFDTTWAWSLLRRLGNRWGAVRGAGGAGEDQGGQRQTRLVQSSVIERDGFKNLTLFRVSSPLAFSEFYRLLRQPRPDPETGEGSWEGYVHLPDDIDDQELAQLTADKEIYDPKKKKRVWTKDGPNEAGDCRKYARAALEPLRIAAWQDAQWTERERWLDEDAKRRELENDASRKALKPTTQAQARPQRPKLWGDD